MRAPRRPLLTLIGLLFAPMMTVGTPASGQEASAGGAVDLELMLAVDASSSVNFQEFSLQMQGIAEAFRNPAVGKAIEAATPNGLAVAMVQWSGEEDQVLAIDWQVLRTEAESVAFGDRVEATPRFVIKGPTAIGTVIDVATLALLTNDYQGRRLVIDVSGDGRTNQGGSTARARARAMEVGITVNGLAILNEEPDLDAYYLAGVVGGPGAFLITADDYLDFARAIARKLLTEISGAPMSSLPPATQLGQASPHP